MTRLQGTDGVRLPVKLSTDPALNGTTPQESFLDHGVLTEQFMELYLYCRAKELVDAGTAKVGDDIVVGWDPRDPEKHYTSAAMQGILKAGLNVVCLDISPTPLVALYTQYIGANCGIVITASHNNATYNGIKIFTKRGLKLLPSDDDKLSEIVLKTNYQDVVELIPTGTIIDHHDTAVEVFKQYSLLVENSWIVDPGPLSQIHLVVDAANGAIAEAAKLILPEAGFSEVIIVNDGTDGAINHNCGAAELEGGGIIAPDTIKADGKYCNNKAIKKLFELGTKYAEDIKSGGKQVCAAVFDGDGDRLYRIDYDPFERVAHILTGDEISVIQSMELLDMGRSRLYYNTVESDISAATTVSKLGYETHLTTVGDKWILLSAIVEYIKSTLPSSIGSHLDKTVKGGTLSADEIESFLDAEKVDLLYDNRAGFQFIGSEESGHTITTGRLKTADGRNLAVFHGNGMKTLLNTFAVTASETFKVKPKERLIKTCTPFACGYKKNIYVYYVNKNKWRRNSNAWKEAKRVLEKSILKEIDGAAIEEVSMAEDQDMLYLRIICDGSHTASIFIRNSGTEDKTGISLRSPVSMSDTIQKIGHETIKVLLAKLKDQNSIMAQAELRLIEIIASRKSIPEHPIDGFDQKTCDQLLKNMIIKQGLVTSSGTITDMGQWYINISLNKNT